MNIKKVFIILICVFASIGCTIQNISDSDIDKNLDVILNKNIKNCFIYLHHLLFL